MLVESKASQAASAKHIRIGYLQEIFLFSRTNTKTVPIAYRVDSPRDIIIAADRIRNSNRVLLSLGGRLNKRPQMAKKMAKPIVWGAMELNDNHW